MKKNIKKKEKKPRKKGKKTLAKSVVVCYNILVREIVEA